MRPLLTRPCRIHLTTTTADRDAMGDLIASTDSAGVVTVCELQRDETASASQERRSNMALQVTLSTLFLLPGEVIDGWSEITVAPAGTSAEVWDGLAGERYTLEGEPEPIRHPRTGVVHHIEATVRKVR